LAGRRALCSPVRKCNRIGVKAPIAVRGMPQSDIRARYGAVSYMAPPAGGINHTGRHSLDHERRHPRATEHRGQ
jgi:hypothetical protein